MKRTLLLTSALATALAALPAPSPVEAASDGALLLRCRMPDGTIGYTDRSCAVFGATATTIDAELVSRIVRDRAHEARLQAAAAGADEDFDMSSATLDAGPGIAAAGLTASAAPGRRSPVAGCARSPDQLADDLHASVALGDVNRIAESYHFAGMSTAAGERVLDRLQHYAGRPVVDSRYYPGSATTAGFDRMTGATTAMPDSGAPGMMQLVVASGDGGGSAAVSFDVHRYEGCYFVSFA